MSYLRAALILLLGLHWHPASAQPVGEAGEPSPEELDAAFTSEDAAREAAAFSPVIIDPGAIDPLGEMVAAAELIFRGRVLGQSFVYESGGTPYTQTTFAIGEVLRGSFPGSEITLVQEGGPAQDGSDSVLLVSGTEHFHVGEEELLFIDLDLDNPVARDRATIRQRFRILEGRVYSEDGRGITVEPVEGGTGRRLVLSNDRHPSGFFRRIHIGPHTLDRGFGDGVGRPDTVTAPATAQATPPVRSYTNAMDVEALRAAMAK